LDGFRTETLIFSPPRPVQDDAQQNAQDDCRKVLAPNGPSVLLWSIRGTNPSRKRRQSQWPRHGAQIMEGPSKTSFRRFRRKLRHTGVTVLAMLETPKWLFLRDGGFAVYRLANRKCNRLRDNIASNGARTKTYW